MFSDLNPSDLGDYLVITVGVLLLFKKIADMEKYHWARVVFLTLILSWFAVMFFVGVTLPPASTYDCVVEFDEQALCRTLR